MTNIRWNILRNNSTITLNKTRDVLEKMGFISPLEALTWFVDEFENVDAKSIYGCGPCCNDFVLPFIRSVENLCQTDINSVVSERFDMMTIIQKKSVLASYDWFFHSCGDIEGIDKIRKLKDSLSHTKYFQDIQARRTAADEASRKHQKYMDIKNAHLESYNIKKSILIKQITEFQNIILSYQSEILRHETEIKELTGQLKNVERAAAREWELYEFERLSVNAQTHILISNNRPLAYYEGRLSQLLDSNNFSDLPKEYLAILISASKTAKPSNLPQVFKLHKILKQINENNS